MAGSIDESRDWLAQAHRALKAYEVLLREGFLSESVARAYRATFCAAKAALVSEGVAATKHSTVIAAFGRHFVATGRLPPELHRTLIDAHDDRRLPDYSPRWEPSDEEARRRIT